MAISGPWIVARAGRTAFNISTSGLAESSLIQNAHSSARTATQVMPRTRRKLPPRTASVMPVVSVNSSAVRDRMSCFMSGVDLRVPSA